LQPAERFDCRRLSNNRIAALPASIEQMSFDFLCAAAQALLAHA
jgi:hypothetical protein